VSLKALQDLVRLGDVAWTAADRLELCFTADGPSVEELRALEDDHVFLTRVFAADGKDITSDSAREGQRLAPGSRIALQVPRIVSGSAIVARDLEDLLSIEMACSRAPQAYFLWKEDFVFESDADLTAAPQVVKRYHDALALVGLLAALQDHKSPDGNILFFHLQKLEICVRFDVGDLNWKVFSREIADFVGDVRAPDRKHLEIFRGVLCTFLRNELREERLGYLIRRSEDFTRTLNESLALYLSENSPQKLFEEAQKNWLSLTEKLEKVILGMEAKSLSIPVALLLAVKEVELGLRLTPINVVILGASLLFAVTLVFFHLSQTAILSIINTEIKTSEQDLKQKGLNDSNRLLKDSFPTLSRRAENTVKGSWCMAVLGCTPVLVCIWAAFIATPKSQLVISNQPPPAATPTPTATPVLP
jgi:hypothetical protein